MEPREATRKQSSNGLVTIVLTADALIAAAAALSALFVYKISLFAFLLFEAITVGLSLIVAMLLKQSETGAEGSH